jgi:flagellar hook protein FlgE
MSVQSALYTGVSGLSTYSKVISIIGNNIANVNTVGFKESRADFAEVLSQSAASPGILQVGLGVRMHGVDRLFSQGGFLSTSMASDLAIDGDGFFIMRDPETSGLLYTRMGNFTLDSDGNLVNAQGHILQGFDVDTDGNSLPSLQDVQINGQEFPPQATASATVNANLNSGAEDIALPFDPTQPNETSTFSTAITVHDSLGNMHDVEVYFQKTAANDWTWILTGQGAELAGTGISGGERTPLAQGRMTFTEQGTLDTIVTTDRLDYSTGALSALPVAEQGANAILNYNTGATLGQTVSFDFGVPRRVSDGSGFVDNPQQPDASGGTTQFGTPSSVLFLAQDGFSSGTLESFNVDDQGIVHGLFSNGKTFDLLQVALAKFPSNVGLNPLGNNLFSQSLDSGAPVVATPETSGLGSIVSNALENSNVDLANQFVELIRAQQAFQANARVITTGDELLTEVVNLRR